MQANGGSWGSVGGREVPAHMGVTASRCGPPARVNQKMPCLSQQ